MQSKNINFGSETVILVMSIEINYFPSYDAESNTLKHIH